MRDAPTMCPCDVSFGSPNTCDRLSIMSLRVEEGYTEREMGERTPDRRSYLAYPVVEGGTENVLGVLYFDSNVCQAFRKDGADDTWRMVEAVVQPVKRALS